METNYTVKTSGYEGPFELLLELIEKRKLFVNDIAIASVTDDFLSYIKTSENRSPSYISAFIVVAATLLLIKSRSLLPNFNLTQDEKEEVGALERRLTMYKIITDVGEKIKKQFGRRPLFFRDEVVSHEPVFAPSLQITKESIHSSALQVLNQIPKQIELPQIEVKKVISIEEMLSRLMERMSTAIKTTFSNFTGVDAPKNKEEKVLVIVGFLAMLELVRQGILDCIQDERFGDMELVKLEMIESSALE